MAVLQAGAMIRGVFADLVPIDVATAEAAEGDGAEELFPEESAVVAKAVASRRTEFAVARHCARRALAALGVAPAPILTGASREPLWPEGIVGSITHCPGYHAAAVARASRYRSIGIDAEPDMPLPPGLLEKICLPGERAQLRSASKTHLDRLLFSAKESVYKTWFPLARRWLGFDEALVELHADGTFEVEVKVAGPLESLTGRWTTRERLIGTAIVLPAS
jgi:4'-phosphopantetheinyl transferase EntD